MYHLPSPFQLLSKLYFSIFHLIKKILCIFVGREFSFLFWKLISPFFSHNAAAFSFNAWLHPPSRNLLFLSQHFLNFPGNFTLTRKKSNNHVPDCSYTTFPMSTRIICVQPVVLHLCIGRLLHLLTGRLLHLQTCTFPLSQTPIFCGTLAGQFM